MAHSVDITLVADLPTSNELAYMAVIISNMFTMTESTNMTEMSELFNISNVADSTKLTDLND